MCEFCCSFFCGNFGGIFWIWGIISGYGVVSGVFGISRGFLNKLGLIAVIFVILNNCDFCLSFEVGVGGGMGGVEIFGGIYCILGGILGFGGFFW